MCRMTTSDFDIIQQNVPEASIELIQSIYTKNKKDIMKTIFELLNIKDIQKEKTEWDKRREICDEYDEQMQKLLQKMRKTNLQKEDGTLNIPITVPSYEPVLKKTKVEETASLSKISSNPNL